MAFLYKLHISDKISHRVIILYLRYPHAHILLFPCIVMRRMMQHAKNQNFKNFQIHFLKIEIHWKAITTIFIIYSYHCLMEVFKFLVTNSDWCWAENFAKIWKTSQKDAIKTSFLTQNRARCLRYPQQILGRESFSLLNHLKIISIFHRIAEL